MVVFKMLRIIVKGILIVVGLVFILALYLNWDLLYGKLDSIQFKLLLFLLSGLIVCLLIDFPVIENFIKGLPNDSNVIGIYFSSLVTVLIGFMGIIALALSVLYGSFYVKYGGIERGKIMWQSEVWILFILYLIIVMFVLFIYPLHERLNS